MVEVDEGEETKVDEEAGMGVEVDGLEMGVGVGVEKNLVLAAERAPLMNKISSSASRKPGLDTLRALK